MHTNLLRNEMSGATAWVKVVRMRKSGSKK